MGIVLILLGLGAIWWLERHPDLDPGIGIVVFGLSWLICVTGIYMTIRAIW